MDYCVEGNGHSDAIKNKNFLVGEELLASYEGLCIMEVVLLADCENLILV